MYFGRKPSITSRYLSKYLNFRLRHEWKPPEGFDTGIKVYCRYKKEKVPLILVDKNLFKWYICGPTVYDVSHLGHASCYIRFDLLNRILREFFDVKPLLALGITDIDDKIIQAALKKNVSFSVLAKQYEIEFFNNLQELNILPPSFVLRVSEHIPDIIEFVRVIIEKGDAYPTEEGSVYFSNPETDENRLDKAVLKPGQKASSDFALWKGAKPDEPFWESPWGQGRPGWHVECSAMASKVFGSRVDVHGGGIDLMFPHHVCEELQSCSFHGCQQWVNYWIHAGDLQVLDKKMSKSLGNFISIEDFLKDHSPDHLRMFCFISKYNKALHWSPESLSHAVDMCNLIKKFLGDANSYVKGNWTMGDVSEPELLQELERTRVEVKKHLMDDFDTGLCHIVLQDLIRTTVKMMCENSNGRNREPAAIATVAQYVREIYESFGFRLDSDAELRSSADSQKLEFVLDEIVSFRNRVRMEAFKTQDKNTKKDLLNACDSLRSQLGTVGVQIKDQGKDVSSWSLTVDDSKMAKSTA